jgi:pilus assembly protein CpaE
MASAPNSRSFGQWKILLVSPHPTMGSEIAPILAEFLPFSPVTELREYPGKQILAELTEEQGINLCFIDTESNRDCAFALMSDLSSGEVKVPVVALLERAETEVILKALRAGAAEFLSRPFQAQPFTEAMERVRTMYRAKGVSGEAKVIAVMPVKGSCGASTVAAHLAPTWKKFGAKRILLADLDPFTGTVSFLLKLRQTYSFLEALNRTGQMDEDIWKGLVMRAAGIDVMLSPEQPAHGIEEVHSPASILDFARTCYDVVVVDTNGVYGPWNLVITQMCDEVLLVCTNDLPALQATQRAMAYLQRNRVERSKIKVVVNRYSKDAGLSKDVIEAALQSEIYQIIPSEPESIQRSLMEGKPPAPSTGIGRGIVALTERLSGQTPAVAEAKSNGLKGIFSSILGR